MRWTLFRPHWYLQMMSEANRLNAYWYAVITDYDAKIKALRKPVGAHSTERKEEL